ncbi:hypothetical protein HDIA_0765 [Hartmannibacter diazotrophicus]|uniref:Uncharacterized protein n=1 Tax=Hartmannibacter diazotrophicus TaxID=1482074 RepID=A0A2C9D232_9HYPH|nr:hypothetical protein [Hartmannibacter diazotrophicus]SON54306.1 hypothetical protein HDIA_0765 [Hartmannibacter diazotrophicus]
MFDKQLSPEDIANILFALVAVLSGIGVYVRTKGRTVPVDAVVGPAFNEHELVQQLRRIADAVEGVRDVLEDANDADRQEMQKNVARLVRHMESEREDH